jgi:nitrous oxide reductase accessory protein NosL
MKRFAFALVLSLLFAGATAFAAAPVEEPAACVQCSMDRTRFAHSRMVVEYDDGSSSGVCSIHCAAADLLKNKGKKVAALKVADYGTKELTDARKATWVVGGKVKGVMTGIPKWAFAKKADAQAFIKENGGAITTFDKMLRASKKEVAAFAR